MQHLEVSCAVRRFFKSLGFQGLNHQYKDGGLSSYKSQHLTSTDRRPHVTSHCSTNMPHTFDNFVSCCWFQNCTSTSTYHLPVTWQTTINFLSFSTAPFVRLSLFIEQTKHKSDVWQGCHLVCYVVLLTAGLTAPPASAAIWQITNWVDLLDAWHLTISSASLCPSHNPSANHSHQKFDALTDTKVIFIWLVSYPRCSVFTARYGQKLYTWYKS